ncbi:hypothetical protein PG993_003875 [Apiospora rasikravindrae]|uniref:SET domain-containing protein n=1 Tax=Apiospora rasikravindrae TaxID=990691 RepID=A0ABR1U325_9PEZI
MFVSPAQFRRLRRRDRSERLQRYNICKTDDRGLGVFARGDIPRSTIIIEEKPLLTLKRAHLRPRRRRDGTALKPIPWQLTVNHLYNALAPEKKDLYDTLSFAEESLADSEWDDIQLSPHRRADPAASEKETLMIAATRDIRKDEEITIAYTEPMVPAKERREDLAPYGFECDCAACKGPDATMHDVRRQALMSLEEQLSDYDLVQSDIEEPKIALGLALAFAHLLKNTGITGQLLDETYVHSTFWDLSTAL